MIYIILIACLLSLLTGLLLGYYLGACETFDYMKEYTGDNKKDEDEAPNKV